MPKVKDLTGEKFGSLLVVGISGYIGNRIAWECKCDCGNVVRVAGCSLKSGNTKSCGCRRNKFVSELNKSHGQSNTRLYHIWTGIKSRCYDVNVKIFKHYGARGITMCGEWKNDFLAFMDWALKNGYSENLSIDRIDVNGNYEPSNCRWVCQKQQCRNTRVNRNITCDGETHTLIEWSEISGVKRETIARRLNKGWSTKEAIWVTPKNKIIM